MLLLHGLSSNGADLGLDRAAAWRDRSMSLPLDQRGHGLSDRPEDGYGFDETTADVAALIDALDLERPVVVGHSWGANVALSLAADHPDSVRGIVLVDGGLHREVATT